MKKRRVLLSAAAILLSGTSEFGGAQQNPATPPQELNVRIDTRQTARPVSPYEYGMFIEHIGSLIYRSLWSELLDDRKFYFPIQPEEPQNCPTGPGRPIPQHATAQMASHRSS